MRILAIGEVGDKTGGDRPREHCIYTLYLLTGIKIHFTIKLFLRILN